MNGHLSYFYLMAIMNHVAMNSSIQIPLRDPVFISIGYIPRNGVVGPYGNSVFNILRNCRTVFHGN